MKIQNAPMYAIALAILVVGLAFAGVPVSTLLVALLVLACPLMMLFMMRGMHGGQGGSQGRHDQHSHHSDEQDHDHRPGPGAFR